MTQYKVTISATEFGEVIVEAGSEEEAREKAIAEEMEGNASWGDRDVEIVEIEEE